MRLALIAIAFTCGVLLAQAKPQQQRLKEGDRGKDENRPTQREAEVDGEGKRRSKPQKQEIDDQDGSRSQRRAPPRGERKKEENENQRRPSSSNEGENAYNRRRHTECNGDGKDRNQRFLPSSDETDHVILVERSSGEAPEE